MRKITLSRKQRLQLQIIDLDSDLDQLANRYPSSKSLVSRIRVALARIVFLQDDVDLQELYYCCSSCENDKGVLSN